VISSLVTPQTSRRRFHLFSMGPPRHSVHETCFCFITSTKFPPFIFQRLGLHYIVIVSSNGSLSHLGHWCCTEIYDFWFSLVTLAWILSHRSMDQSTPTQGHFSYLVDLNALFLAPHMTKVLPPKWHGPVVTYSLYHAQEINVPRGGHVCPYVGSCNVCRESPYFSSIIAV
jgi:hypothetical protein